MSLPGWYPDPSGARGRFRHWDGQSWSAQTTDDPRNPPPLGAGGGGAPVPPARKARPLPWIIGGIATLLVVAVVIAAMWRFTAGDTPTTSPSPTEPAPTNPADPTDPSDPSPDGGQTPPAAVNCAAAGGSIDSTAPEYTTGGLRYAAVPGWGFRFDRYTWGWVENVAAWGTLVGDEYAAGIVVGGLRTEDGFADPQQATEATLECMQTHGSWNDRTYDWAMTGSETTVDGLPAHELSGTVTPGPTDEFPGYTVRIVVVDTGEPDEYGVWISFHPTGDEETGELIELAYSTLSKA